MSNVRFSIVITGLLCAGAILAIGPEDKGKKGQPAFEQLSSLDQLPEKGVECVSKSRGDGYSAADLNKLRAVATAASGKDTLVRKGILKPGMCYVQVCKSDKGGNSYYSQVWACHGPKKQAFDDLQKPNSNQFLTGFVAGGVTAAAVFGYLTYRYVSKLRPFRP